jgi:hypothetical protein
VFRWVPAGITGLARPRQWDATIAFDLPELAGETVGEFGFVAFEDAVVGPDAAPAGLCERIAVALDAEVRRPYEALVVRRGSTEWMAGARRINVELISLPAVAAEVLEVALSPDGELSAALDGRPIEGLVDPSVDAALRELERRGRARFQAFAARADNLGGERWQLTLDPL